MGVPRSTIRRCDYLDATHAHGPSVARWLDEGGHTRNLIYKGVRVDRQVRRWRHGENPSIGALDRTLLEAFGVMVSELPNDVWLLREWHYLRAAVEKPERQREESIPAGVCASMD